MNANPLHSLILNEMNQNPHHRISCKRFMELALYHPQWGYYRREQQKLGKNGDFFTNAHVGELFGKVLGHWFYRLQKPEAHDQAWTCVEMGAGDGRLTEQVIRGLLEAGQNPSQLSVIIVETSSYHRRLQQELLATCPVEIEWVEQISKIPPSPFSILYSNELVDAFPVYRIKREGGQWLESFIVVDSSQQSFYESWNELSSQELVEFLQETPIEGADGQVLEIHIEARRWLKEIATWMEKGYLLTVDYGGCTQDLLVRSDGTLRGFRQHQLHNNWLQDPGETDLTANVNFEWLEKWGKEVGLETIFTLSQSQFLLRTGILDHLPREPILDPFSQEAKKMRVVHQLIHPHAMGEAFLANLQVKNIVLKES
ncbi:class I SAM-dependent methyltransferase [Hazenella coriacea]|uniref:SAM-dependent MidA family methyltransferase n=1 Tax=Hazenella coriacea TaxID=1179467 RepID=A0A4R3L4F8_9BACL|nr:SAM-dependent methyltransferase [Hazenella coriacea]TCS94651.1 SAM-dependent MidA family methyltransferase [Hazenella coriacea]